MARWGSAKREEVRRQLLDAARTELEANGFEKMTLRSVAARAGVAVGTLFNYFPDKRTLLLSALHDDIEEVRRESLASAPIEADLRTLLVHVAGSFFDYYARRPALSRALLKEGLFATGEAAEGFRAQVALVGEALTKRVASLQTQGELSPVHAPERVVLAFFSYYYFVLLMELGDTADPERMRNLVAGLVDQLLIGVGTRAEAP